MGRPLDFRIGTNIAPQNYYNLVHKSFTELRRIYKMSAMVNLYQTQIDLYLKPFSRYAQKKLRDAQHIGSSQ